MTDHPVDLLLQLVFAGVVMVLIGTVLAPLIPFDLVAMGWVVVILAVVAAVAFVVIAVARLAGAVGGR